jgi:hypothetical protein
MADAKLPYASVALLALNVVHALDHVVNQNQGLGAVGFIGGGGILLSLVAVGLAATGAGLAGPYLALIGFGEAAAFLLIHVAPSWGPISDPYYDSGTVNALSWFVLAICICVSLWVAMTGVNAMRSREAGVS